MLNNVRFGIAISSAALASAITGCSAQQGHVASASSFGGKADGEVGLAMRALVALNEKNYPAAINFAERSVAKTPDDAGFRALLGNAYFASGRFSSAESAFKDSLSIYSNQPQIVLKLALVQIAQGKVSEAVAFLDAARSVLDPADYGLALALAGHAPDAVVALRAAARTTGADARVRQNLALAYALSGDWANARVVAAQDLAPNLVDGRIQQWMKFAKPGRASDQVASLTGVSPAASDPGQPTRLALRGGDSLVAVAAPAQAQPQAVPQPHAMAQPIAVPVASSPAPPSAGAEPQPEVALAIPPAPPPADPVRIAAVAGKVAPPPIAAAAYYVPPPLPFVARPAFARAAAVAHKPVRLQRAAAAHVRSTLLRRGGSTSVVQLGAYGSSQRVLAAWTSVARRYSALRAYAPMSARFDTGRGMVYRLSVRGFASNGEASTLCAALHRSGGTCFVRTVAGDAPVQIASR